MNDELSFDKQIWNISGKISNGGFSFALNAETEEDAIQRALGKLCQVGVESSRIESIEVTQLLPLANDINAESFKEEG